MSIPALDGRLRRYGPKPAWQNNARGALCPMYTIWRYYTIPET